MADNLRVVGRFCEHGVIPEALSHFVEADGDEEGLSGFEYFHCIPFLKETTPPLTTASARSLFPTAGLMQGS